MTVHPTTISAKVIEDSIGIENGVRLTTLQLCYPRFIHAEFMTHRVFSRNAASSRAIPVAKMIEQVRNSPAMPIHWGKNQPGMQAREEIQHAMVAKDLWMRAARLAADKAEEMANIGLHKQVVNRILEPFQWMHTIVTATEWDNFFLLRDHADAQPEIRALAIEMKRAMRSSMPMRRSAKDPESSDNWHLPYVSADERQCYRFEPRYLAKLSTARNARVSFLNHDGTQPNQQKDIELHERLVGSEPLHASPTEHIAHPMMAFDWCKNFRGWVQYRRLIEGDRS